MKRTIRTTVAATAALTLLTACGGSGGEEDGEFSPDGDVTMLIPFAAGGGSDLAGRATAAAMEAANDDLNINVENRDGGSGAVGYAELQGESGNDQYLLATETALLALPLSGVVDWTYEDFTPIMKIADDFTLMVTRADAPYETCSDVVEAAESDRIVAGISGATGLDNVVFTGAVPHELMPAALARAHIGVAPFDLGAHKPLSLGFYWSPLKMFEYMAAGLPVVAPAAARIPALVSDGREGLLYDPNDPGALARTLEQLADPQLRARLGAGARKRAVREYSWRAHCEALARRLAR